MSKQLLSALLFLTLSAACAEETDSPAMCTRRVTVNATFWKNTSWAWGVRCDGLDVTCKTVYSDGREPTECAMIDDNDNITCDAPAVETYVMEYTSPVDSICVARVGEGEAELVPGCEDQTVSVTASGSAEEGPKPMIACDVVEGD